MIEGPLETIVRYHDVGIPKDLDAHPNLAYLPKPLDPSRT